MRPTYRFRWFHFSCGVWSSKLPKPSWDTTVEVPALIPPPFHSWMLASAMPLTTSLMPLQYIYNFCKQLNIPRRLCMPVESRSTDTSSIAACIHMYPWCKAVTANILSILTKQRALDYTPLEAFLMDNLRQSSICIQILLIIGP